MGALSLRDAIEQGLVLGPRLVCAGQPITVPNGHCHQWGGAVRTMQDARDVVRRQVDKGVNYIKVMATGGMKTAGTKPELAQFSEEDLQAITSIANSHGLPVAAHAH